MRIQIWLLGLCFLPVALKAQQHSLDKVWETDTIVAVPESVLGDRAGELLYVSLIDGGPWDVDGKGGVGKLGLDGKHYEGSWITGLNAPKGLGRYGNRLYVADISEVVVIDITKGKIEKKIPVAGANGLNDITVDSKGIVYVSDSRAGKVYRIEHDMPSLYMDDLEGANGLKCSGSNLYILAKKAVLIADANKKIRKITDLPNGGDGVEEVGNGDLIVSEWIGFVYYVYADGRKETLLDTHLQKKNTADIHYDPSTHMLYVPGFNARTVTAYRLRSGGVATSSRSAGSSASVSATPGVLLMDAGHLANLKARVAAKDDMALASVARLREKADKLLDKQPMSVMEKDRTPPSGNKHDYMSQAPYFWYDSSKPNGLPYINRDGQRNPEIYKITDRRYIGELDEASRTLALAWWLTGDEKYAQKATLLLRAWFLDDKTSMNPNLDYAQGVPGITTGRSYGIIESIALTGIADAATLLHGSSSWTKKDEDGLREWYTRFLDWMLTSKNGTEEHAAKNNHGIWYLAQAVDFALFTDNREKARQLAREGMARVDSQIRPDGTMPLELARTNGLWYSTYSLQAFFTLARLAETVNIDLWNYHNAGGAGIRTALDWLRPYAMGDKKWEYQQITPYNQEVFYELLVQAGLAYRDQGYLTDARRMEKKDGDVVVEVLYAQR
jgi:hypothetical protein